MSILDLQNLQSDKQDYLRNADSTDIVSISTTTKNNSPQVFYHTLPNGLQIMYIQGSNVLNAVQYTFNVGQKNDGHLYGLSHLTEHMVFRGTRDRTSKDLWSKIVSKDKGGACTTYESTKFFKLLNSNDYTTVVKTMVDMFTNSTLTNLEEEKRVVKCEITREIDRGESRMINAIYSNALCKTLCNYSLQKKILPYITEQDIKNHIQQYYVPSNATLIIAGDMGNKDSVFKTLARLHSDWGQQDGRQKNIEKNNQQSAELIKAFSVLDLISQSNIDKIDTARIEAILKQFDSFEYYPGLYKDAMPIESVHCGFFLRGSPINKHNVNNFIQNRVLINLLSNDLKEWKAINSARYDGGFTYTGFTQGYVNQSDHGLWGITSYTDKEFAREVLIKMAKYIRDFKGTINHENVDKAISNIKLNISDAILKDFDISVDDFQAAADSIKVQDVKNYFNNSINFKCAVGVAGGFDDAVLDDGLYVELNNILLEQSGIQPQDFII
jgi:hypothetical protein